LLAPLESDEEVERLLTTKPELLEDSDDSDACLVLLEVELEEYLVDDWLP